MDLIIEQMKKISLSEDPLPLLIEIKANLIAISGRDLTCVFEIGSNLSQVEPLFDFLNTDNNEQILICIDILGYVISKIKPQLALEFFINKYILCLKHPHEKIRLFALKQLHVCTSNAETCQLLLRNTSLLLIIINSLSDSSLEIVKISQDIIIKMCSYPNAIKHVFTPEAFEILKTVMNKSDSYKFHVYDLCVKISSIDNDCMATMASCGLLYQLVNEVFGGDILTQLNALQLLSEMTVNAGDGLKLLKTDGIVTKLSYLLTSSRNDQMIAVLLPGLLKFFGHLGSVQPQILVEEESLALREIMRLSCDFSGDTEIALQLIAFETLCHIGSTVDGKNALKKFGVETEESLKDFFSHMSSFPTDMKIRVLESLAKLFYLPLSEQTEDLIRQLETLFEQLSTESPMNKIYSLARQPFPEIRCASLSLMQSLCQYTWGLKLLVQEPGLFEWLLNRDTCKDKESKEIRYGIISTIHNLNITTKDFLGEEIISSIATIFNQGPFYVEYESFVAVEKND